MNCRIDHQRQHEYPPDQSDGSLNPVQGPIDPFEKGESNTPTVERREGQKIKDLEIQVDRHREHQQPSQSGPEPRVVAIGVGRGARSARGAPPTRRPGVLRRRLHDEPEFVHAGSVRIGARNRDSDPHARSHALMGLLWRAERIDRGSASGTDELRNRPQAARQFTCRVARATPPEFG
jgi:hypothetical protein